MPVNEPTLKQSVFRGLQLKDSPEEVGIKGFTVASNIDISRKRKISRRRGFVSSLATSIDSALITDNFFITQNNDVLYSFDGASNTTLVSGLSTPSSLNGVEIGGRLYFSNGYETGTVAEGVYSPLGTLPPPRPILTPTSGNLGAGRYLVTCSYVLDNGLESGSGITSLIELPVNSGISMAGLPSEKVNVYITTTNGDTPYFADDVLEGVTSYEYREETNVLQRPVRYMHRQPPPAFQASAWFGSRLIIASGGNVYYSDPFAYHLFDLRYSYIPIGDYVTMVAPVRNGVYIGTRAKIYFLHGTDIKDSKMTLIDSYGAIEGTLAYVDEEYVALPDGAGSSGIIPVWASTNGIYFGLQSGNLINSTSDSVDFPGAIKGSSCVRQESGQTHFITTLQS